MDGNFSIARAYGQSQIQAGPEVTVFAAALDDCLKVQGAGSEKRARLLKLVEGYHQYATERYQSIQKRRGKSDGPPSFSMVLHEDAEMDLDDCDEVGSLSQSSNKGSQDALNWKQEALTWDLLRRLLPIRYPDPKAANRTSRLSNPRAASKGLWQEFIDSDSVVVERKAVLHWLQNSASSGPDINELVRDLQQNADRGDLVAHGWIHTRSAIKLKKRILAHPHPLDHAMPEIAQTHINADGAPLVTQLDPDSIARQGRKLEPQDEYFERATWLGCYELLRRGHSSEAIREWCLERTEGWRAVSMSALSLAPQDGGPAPETSPESLALWRRTCLAIARQGDADDYERAVYGILGGDIATVERVCNNWDDFVFSHYNALVRSQFDSFVLAKCAPEDAASLSQSFLSFDATLSPGDSAPLEKRLMRSLESNSLTAAEAREPLKVFQASILSQDLERYFFDQGLVLGLHANKETESKLIPTLGLSSSGVDSRRFYTLANHHGLRIVAHAYMVLSQLEALYPGSTATAVSSDSSRALIQQNSVSAYISLMRLSGAYELVPLYCSTLDATKQYDALCRNLIHVTDDAIRINEINLILKAGLDPLKFVKDLASLQLDAVLGRGESPSAAAQFKIMEDGPATLKCGRPVRTDFFGDDPDRIDPLHELLIRSIEWLALVDDAWPDVLSTATKAYKYFLKNLHLNAARQFAQRLSFVDILRQRGFEPEDEVEGLEPPDTDFWAYQLSMVKSSSEASALQIAGDARSFRELESLVRALDAMETLASLEELSREDATGKREFWAKVATEVKAVKEYMTPILHDWLQAGDEELHELRKWYLPETVLAYVSTLHFAGTALSRDYLLECMELAAVIAEKDSDIAACFVEGGRMRELVEAFASCSKALAVKTGDKKALGSSSKKMREMGWSRDLWSVKSAGGGR